MLSGLKFIPRDLIEKTQDENSDARRKSGSEKSKHRRKKKSFGYSSSDDDLEKIRKGSRKKKWYSSDEYSASDSSGSKNKSEGSLGLDDKKRRSGKKSRRIKKYSSEDEASGRSKKRSRKRDLSQDNSSSGSEDDLRKRSGKDGRKSGKGRRSEKDIANDNLSDDGRGSPSLKDEDIVRKEMGLEWMLRPAKKTDTRPTVTIDNQPEEPPSEEIKKMNPKELNPYWKDNGGGYPDDGDEKKAGGDRLLSSSVVGDGGASWRLKALKRAKEQAAREGRRLEEVVEERWGSLGQLAVSAASRSVAPSHAHLHAIKNRKKGLTEEHQTVAGNQSERHTGKNSGRDYLRDVSVRHPEMRAPKMHDSLSWGKRKSQNVSTEDADLISAVVSSLNKFANDGSFMHEMLRKQSNDSGGTVDSHTNTDGNTECKTIISDTSKLNEGTGVVTEGLSANQLAAKALQLRMKGKPEEAQKLLQEVESMKAKQGAGDDSVRPHDVRSTSRYSIQDISARKKEDDSDMHLARRIMQNKKYTDQSQVEDEYDYDDGPSRKSRKNGGAHGHKGSEKDNRVKRILTQQERCLFCFENPNRPKHLVVSIANFTYLMLPQWQTVVPGHCCILPMQHEAATRTVDDNVWEEIRNFKKCLIMMFAKQEKELVFLETVMGLAQQRRHCLIECIPLPQEVAKQAPLYFKKAIDEAEDEWSQHNAKRLIDTSQKGLRNSIPKDFPYFHVEFGLNKGFVHVIDDEKQFKSSLGLNVIRGMLRLPEEDMYRRRRRESVEAQKQAVASFAQDWEPFDWTKQLG